MDFVVVIPARYQSSRLPGKPLADIAGKPMVEWVVEKAVASGASRVVVATDDDRIQQAVEQTDSFEQGLCEVCMTSPDHQSGTERLAEVVDTLQLPTDTIIVNVQGDEPLIPPSNIRQVAENLANSTANMATLSVAIKDEQEVFNPNAVKVVTDHEGYALYFSRASIPWDRSQFASEQQKDLSATLWQRHIGIYAYRAGFIKQYVTWPESQLEQIEALEQLRVLWYGEKIHVATACEAPPAGVDTPDDLDVVRKLVSKQ